MPENTLQKYFDKIDDLQEEVKEQKEDILKGINIQNLLANPKEYLEDLAMDYYEANEEILNDAIQAGENKAKKILDIYVKTD